MAGNSQRRGAGHKGKGNTAGSGGRVRRGLEGKGPTPKAEDRPYHKAYRSRPASAPGKSGPRQGGSGERRRTAGGAEWVAGRNPVLEALTAGLPVKAAYVADGVERDDRLRDIFRMAAERGLTLMQATRGDLDKLTAGAVHQGIALQLPAYEYAHPEDVLGDALQADPAGLVVALDGVTDPRNLGAIIRSAAAFGAHGVIVPERRSASMTAAAWKSSAGAAARLPVARATNLARTLAKFAEAGFMIVGLAGEAEVDISAIPGAGGPVVLVVGGEGAGLGRLVRSHCDVLASIPIASEVESLNAGVAAAVALYEVSRLRG